MQGALQAQQSEPNHLLDRKRRVGALQMGSMGLPLVEDDSQLAAASALHSLSMGSCTPFSSCRRAPVEEVNGFAGHDSQSADVASTQTVHLTIAMLIERASETRQTMCIDGNHCCVQQTLLRYKCLHANTSEIDLTSGEQFPWKQLFLNIPFDKAQKVIGDVSWLSTWS